MHYSVFTSGDLPPLQAAKKGCRNHAKHEGKLTVVELSSFQRLLLLYLRRFSAAKAPHDLRASFRTS